MKNRLYTWHVQAQTWVSNRSHFLHSHLPHPLYLSQDLVCWECVCVCHLPSIHLCFLSIWYLLYISCLKYSHSSFHMTLKMSVQEDLLQVWLIFCAFVGILALFLLHCPCCCFKAYEMRPNGPAVNGRKGKSLLACVCSVALRYFPLFSFLRGHFRGWGAGQYIK